MKIGVGDKINQRTFNIVLEGQAKEDFGKGFTQVRAAGIRVTYDKNADGEYATPAELILYDLVITSYKSASTVDDVEMQVMEIPVVILKKGTWRACVPIEDEEVSAICDT